MDIMSFIGGLFEGEGCASVSRVRPKNRPETKAVRLDLGMTDKEPVDLICGELGGKVALRSHQNPKWKPLYIWHIHGVKAVNAAIKLFPYMTSRRRKQQLLDVINFYMEMPQSTFDRAMKLSERHWRNK